MAVLVLALISKIPLGKKNSRTQKSFYSKIPSKLQKLNILFKYLLQVELYLYKGVNSHDSHVWLTLGIVHQVEVDQLFQLQVVSLHAVHNIWEQSTKRRGEEKVLHSV